MEARTGQRDTASTRGPRVTLSTRGAVGTAALHHPTLHACAPCLPVHMSPCAATYLCFLQLQLRLPAETVTVNPALHPASLRAVHRARRAFRATCTACVRCPPCDVRVLEACKARRSAPARLLLSTRACTPEDVHAQDTYRCMSGSGKENRFSYCALAMCPAKSGPCFPAQPWPYTLTPPAGGEESCVTCV